MMKKSKFHVKGLLTVAVSLLMLLCMAACDRNALDVELLPVKAGNVWGYIDAEGHYVINPQFDEAGAFRGDMALVRKDKKYGYINKKGKYVINPVYKAATPFIEGIAWVVKSGGAPTAVNADGEELFVLKNAETVGNYREGLANYSVLDDGVALYGYVDKNGKTVIAPSWRSADSFSEGLACVYNGEKYGYIDKTGEVVINYQFKTAGRFKNGHAIVGNDDFLEGIIDKNGKYVVNPQFDMLLYDDEKYVVKLQGNDKFGWCDADGKITINPQFDNVGYFNDNDLVPVMINNKCGFIDKTGKIVINPQYDGAARCFLNNKYALVASGDKWGIIDKEGRYLANPQFDGYGWDLFSAIQQNESHSVTTDYFDIETVVNKLVELLKEDKVDGMTFKTPLSSFISKYAMNKKEIYAWRDLHTLRKDVKWTKDVTFNLAILGNFHKDVSDGWWGTKKVLVESSTPGMFVCTLELSGNGYGKQDALYAAVLKRLGVSDKGKGIMTGKMGNLRLTIQKNNNEVIVKVMDAKATLPPPPPVASDVESLVIVEDYTYSGNIDGRFDIVMKLDVAGSSVSGSYYYMSKKSPITLEGTIEDGESITLYEKVNGKTTGQFIGTMTANEISGTWLNADGTKSMPFLVTKQ